MITKIVIHCSDSPDDMDVKAEDVHGWHLDNGWSGIGYHAVIERDGSLEWGRPKYWKGSHVRGHNHEALGVCLVGRVNFDKRQLSTLRSVINMWLVEFPRAEIMGHYELDDSKTCPNFDVKGWWLE